VGIEHKVETLSFAQLEEMARPAFEHRAPGGVEPPSDVRDECRRILRDAEPVGPQLTIEHPPDEGPFVYYGDAPLDVRFYRLRAAPPP
jgi:hypothetical protein